MFPLGSGNGNGWELAGSGNPNRLGEAYFAGQTTFTAGTGPISLGAAYNNLSGVEDLAFLWTNSQGEVYNARVEYVGVAPGIGGDYNDDGFVNAADYTVWRDNLGANVTLPNDSTPGSVSNDDYAVWSGNYGKTFSPSTSQAAAVPEPGAVLLLCGAVGLATSLQRPRRG